MKVKVKLLEVERIKRGWSKGELATRIDKSPSAVSRVLNGRSLSPRVLKELADLLGVPINELLED